MTPDQLQAKIAEYGRMAQEHFEQWQRAIGAIAALTDVLNAQQAAALEEAGKDGD